MNDKATTPDNGSPYITVYLGGLPGAKPALSEIAHKSDSTVSALVRGFIVDALTSRWNKAIKRKRARGS